MIIIISIRLLWARLFFFRQPSSILYARTLKSFPVPIKYFTNRRVCRGRRFETAGEGSWSRDRRRTSRRKNKKSRPDGDGRGRRGKGGGGMLYGNRSDSVFARHTSCGGGTRPKYQTVLRFIDEMLSASVWRRRAGGRAYGRKRCRTGGRRDGGEWDRNKKKSSRGGRRAFPMAHAAAAAAAEITSSTTRPACSHDDDDDDNRSTISARARVVTSVGPCPPSRRFPSDFPLKREDDTFEKLFKTESWQADDDKQCVSRVSISHSVWL